MSTPTPIPNTVTKTLLCINKQENEDFSGVLYNPFMPEAIPFSQAKEILDILEQFFNDIAYPQSYFQYRSFLKDKSVAAKKEPAEVKRYAEDSLLDQHNGDIATFIVQVKFRQNATWQGDLLWKETDTAYEFRSTLEMLRLINSALEHKAAASE